MEFPTPSPMNFDVPNVAEGWKKWEKSFEVYRTAREAFKKPEKVQVALLLHIAGPDAQTFLTRSSSGPEKARRNTVMFFRNFVNMWNLIGMWCTRGTFSGQEINKRMNRSTRG